MCSCKCSFFFYCCSFLNYSKYHGESLAVIKLHTCNIINNIKCHCFLGLLTVLKQYSMLTNIKSIVVNDIVKFLRLSACLRENAILFLSHRWEIYTLF